MFDFDQALNTLGGADISLDGGLSVFTFKLVLLIAIACGLASCFFGFKIQRVLTSIMAAITLGLSGGIVVAQAANGAVGLIVGIIFAALGAFIGFKFFKAMFVILIGINGAAIGFVVALLFTHSSDKTTALIVSCVVALLVGALAAFITTKIFRPFIIIATSIQGGLISGYAIVALFTYKGWVDYLWSFVQQIFDGKSNSSWIVIALIFIVLGAIFQFKTAGHKIKDVLSKMKDNAENPLDITNPDGTTGAITNKIMAALHVPHKLLTDIHNIQFYFLGSAIIAVLSLFQGGGVVTVILKIAMCGLFTMLFMSYQKVKVPPIYTNIAFGVAAIISAISLLIRVFGDGDGVYSLLLFGSIGLFVISLWLVIAKNKTMTLPLVISGCMGIVCFLYTVIGNNGSFGFTPLIIVCSCVPFSIPFIKNMIEKNKVQQNQPNPVSQAQPAQAPIHAQAVLVGAASTVAENEFFCEKCGNQVGETAGFCTVCGTEKKK